MSDQVNKETQKRAQFSYCNLGTPRTVFVHLKFLIPWVARVKLSFKLQQSFPAIFLETCQFIVLLFIDWWN